MSKYVYIAVRFVEEMRTVIVAVILCLKKKEEEEIENKNRNDKKISETSPLLLCVTDNAQPGAGRGAASPGSVPSTRPGVGLSALSQRRRSTGARVALSHDTCALAASPSIPDILLVMARTHTWRNRQQRGQRSAAPWRNLS